MKIPPPLKRKLPTVVNQIYQAASLLLKIQTNGRQRAWKLVEMQHLNPHPDLLDQNLRFNKSAGDSYAHESVRSTG